MLNNIMYVEETVHCKTRCLTMISLTLSFVSEDY